MQWPVGYRGSNSHRTLLPGSWLLSAACGLRANGDHGIWHHNMVSFGNVWLDNMVFVEVVLLDVFVVLV